MKEFFHFRWYFYNCHVYFVKIYMIKIAVDKSSQKKLQSHRRSVLFWLCRKIIKRLTLCVYGIRWLNLLFHFWSRLQTLEYFFYESFESDQFIKQSNNSIYVQLFRYFPKWIRQKNTVLKRNHRDILIVSWCFWFVFSSIWWSFFWPLLSWITRILNVVKIILSRRLIKKICGSKICAIMVMEKEVQQNKNAASQMTSNQTKLQTAWKTLWGQKAVENFFLLWLAAFWSCYFVTFCSLMHNAPHRCKGRLVKHIKSLNNRLCILNNQWLCLRFVTLTHVFVSLLRRSELRASNKYTDDEGILMMNFIFDSWLTR